MSYFPETHTNSKNKIKFELDLPSYATKSDLKMKQVLINHNLLKNWFREFWKVTRKVK